MKAREGRGLISSHGSHPGAGGLPTALCATAGAAAELLVVQGDTTKHSEAATVNRIVFMARAK